MNDLPVRIGGLLMLIVGLRMLYANHFDRKD